MKTIYQSRVTEIGSQVDLFLMEKMLILFNDTAPFDLRDIAVVHNVAELSEGIEVGDEFVIGEETFKVTFVGAKVNETMEELGHCTITFNGATEADQPGILCVEEKEIPEISLSSEILFKKAAKEAQTC